MAFNLSEQEIRQRLIRLNNLEMLHIADRKKIKKQAEEIKFLKRRIEILEEQNKKKDEIIEKFSLQLEELRIKVFGKKGKDKVKPKKGDKAKRATSSYQRPIPTDITKEETHTIDACDLCQTVLAKKRTRIFYVEDIPFEQISILPQREAVKHTVEQGYCEKYKKWRTAIPLPFGKCVLGFGVQKYISYLSIVLRLSNQQIEEHIKNLHHISISQGEVQKILYKEADRLRPEFERLKQRVRSQKAQHYDETSWKTTNGTFGSYGWGMFGVETKEAVFLLGKSRGGGNMKELNPNPIIGITDGYNVYKNAFQYHQLCWAHPHRKFRELAESGELEGMQKENCVSDFRAFVKIYAKISQTIKTEFNYEKTRAYFLKRITAFSKLSPNDLPKTKTLKTTLFKNRETKVILISLA